MRVLKITPKPNWPGIGCTTSDLVCTSCTCGVQENGAIGLVVLQSTEILGLIIMFHNTIPIVCSKTVAYSYFLQMGMGLNSGKYTYIHTHTFTKD